MIRKVLYGWPLENINGINRFPLHASSSVIGIIDSGVYTTNIYLINQKIQNIPLDSNSEKWASNLHGTMVAGIIATNGDGVQTPGGYLPNVEIISIQTGSDAGMSHNQMARAINLAVAHGVEVINISQGSPDYSSEVEFAINNALSKGIVIVASSGNDGKNINDYPARFDDVIAVSALDKNNNPTSYTNIEPTNIFAPGEYLMTTGRKSEDHIAWFRGSSAATPIVASICAVIKQNKPEWNSKMVKESLLLLSDKHTINTNVNILNVGNVFNYLSID
ncbi:S8 family serine peptidase [Paenibacillus sp. NPDC057967]|uniref:S8 family peptidase n=1 Tax=Paenibacillus sp. NPDC057967 TaxID=3346293 RepID=UPI0036DB5412